MYYEHFKLQEAPFSITPDPAFVYMSPRHREALGHLLYGTGRHGGFVQLTGEVGTGKTTIVRTLLAQELDAVDVAVILNPRQSEAEFVASICDELHVSYTPGASLKEHIDALNRHLLNAHSEGRRTVVIIDEAQNLSRDVLEQVRLLTNLETHKEKLLRIMLVGQPELAELLARPDLRQVAQRITARFHLTPLSAAETGDYIRHRLRVAGGDTALFNAAAVKAVHKLTGGVPRLINILSDRSLLGAYAKSTGTVTPEMVRAAAVEALGTEVPSASTSPPRSVRMAAAVVLLLGLGAAFGYGYSLFRSTGAELPPPVAEATPVPQAPSVAAAETPAAPASSAAAGTAPPAKKTIDVKAATAKPYAGTAQPLRALIERLLQRWEWQVDVAEGERVCVAISRAGLDCYRGNGDWATLRALNRPAILTTLSDAASTEYHLLLELRGDQAELATANGSRAVALSSLDPHWTGEFLLLWQPQAGSPLIGPASNGPEVIWLRETLDRIAGRPRDPNPYPNYGPQLLAAVQAFQATRGLDTDGLVGTRTLIALNAADPEDTGPKLSNSVDTN